MVASAFDARILANATIPTAPASMSNVAPQLASLEQTIAARVRPGVLVSSIGSPADGRHTVYAQWNELAAFIAANGGTEAAIQNYAPNQAYALAGIGNVGEGQGSEVGSMLTSGSAGRIQGMLTRDADWRLTPLGGEFGPARLALLQNALPAGYSEGCSFLAPPP